MNSHVIPIVTLAGAAAASVWVDVRTRRVPNVITFGLAATGLALAIAGVGSVTWSQAILGLIVGLALMLPAHVLGALGAGDVKLFAATGTVLGPKAVAVAFFYTLLAGGLLALAVAVWRRRLRTTTVGVVELLQTAGANAAAIEHTTRNNRFAYAPAIAIGTIAAALGF